MCFGLKHCSLKSSSLNLQSEDKGLHQRYLFLRPWAVPCSHRFVNMLVWHLENYSARVFTQQAEKQLSDRSDSSPGYFTVLEWHLHNNLLRRIFSFCLFTSWNNFFLTHGQKNIYFSPSPILSRLYAMTGIIFTLTFLFFS